MVEVAERSPTTATAGGMDLLRLHALRRFLRSRWYPGFFQVLSVGFLVLLLAFAFFGPDRGGRNLATVVTWTLWWPLLPISLVLLGRVWCAVCPLAALGIYSVTKDAAAQALPEPYTGKLYDLYLECLNGSEFVKLITYEPIPEQDRLAILKKLIPKPQAPAKVELFSWLPENRIPDSEMYFNGPLSLRNFTPVLGRSNIFEVGKKAKAVGCLVEGRDKPFRWVIVAGDETELRQGKERLLKNLNQQEYRMETREGYQLLEDRVSGSSFLIISKGTRLHFVFGIQRGDIGELLEWIQKQRAGSDLNRR
ncbi:MAG: hypothetical protein ONB05_04075 [candidate division KSB1 bacterium]|nr:hypothetical protein [candidate division KSB1 bacterium]